jgi:pyruvate,orthophosphate dikinase
VSSKYVYRFGLGRTEGRATMRDLLGGKGANLAEMAAAGLPVPPGFTISTEVCAVSLAAGGKLPDAVVAEIDVVVKELEEAMGARFGDVEKPLLVSVRSGAAISMPGMMDTILNLGMNDDVVLALAKKTQNGRFAWDCYRRFLEMFACVVVGVDRHAFDAAMTALKNERGKKNDRELDEADLRELVNRFKAVYRRETGHMFPVEPREQLERAIGAVFQSWNSDRAIKYREVQKIRGLAGTAVNVQAMVFGNMGPTSGTGVCFTRNPSTGAKELYGEYLADAQGEDIVAGIRTPDPVAALEQKLPAVYEELVSIAERLERHFKNMQDVEFTVQEGRLFMLQTRHGKRTGAAALKVAVDLVDEGICGHDYAVLNLVEPAHLDQMLHPHFADEQAYRKEGRVISKGLPASPGAAVGKLVFNAEDAEAWAARGEKVILARVETSPEDVGGMHAAQGILTTRGGMTSHAAVVARGWGRPCVAGCGDVIIDYGTKTLTNGKVTVREGELVSLNGTTGEVISGAVSLADALISDDFKRFMGWVDETRTLGVRTNADTPKDAKTARDLGAQGIGLCRTEHMFFEADRIREMRRMILSESASERKAALDRLIVFQRDDFRGIFLAMEGLPVTIRLLDPPLHEFLPQEKEQIAELAKEMGISPERLAMRVAQHHEANPMLGHRGCRLGITHPEITEMQSRAIFEAACALVKEGRKVHPEIMVPLVGTPEELVDQRDLVIRTAEAVLKEQGVRVDYLVGTMIEVPRAALLADQIAKEAQFFSFGTNDLTQMTFGYSRDDAGTFLPHYVVHRILADDPFQTIDVAGVGALVRMACEKGRAARPGIKLGICGEHGGDPKSIAFFATVGLDYVSCSPFRVPIARLAAAQAALRARGAEVKVGEQ